MNFVALLLGLIIERLLTHFLHLREFRWLDPIFDAVGKRLQSTSIAVAYLVGVALAAAVVLPVALMAYFLQELLFLYFILSVIVILISLGPRDLKIEVDDYCEAIDISNEESAHRVARELLEDDPPADPAERDHRIERAILIQANNRLFGVVFWFVVLGPSGAWLFRVLDLMRRRVAYQFIRREDKATVLVISQAVRTLHGIAAWIPARLLMVGFVLAGNYEGAVSAWRSYYGRSMRRFYEVTEDVVSLVGAGAVQPYDNTEGAAPGVVRARNAMGLIVRTFRLIWLPVIAVLTLSGWLN